MSYQLRCQWFSTGNWQGYPEDQCTLAEGHKGEHRTTEQIKAERHRNEHPTLDDIRTVVREEFNVLLTEYARMIQERYGS